VRTDDQGPNVSWSHQLRINAAGQFEHYLFDGGGVSVTATDPVQPGVWYHVAATAVNGGSSKIYINGIASPNTANLGNLWGGGNQWLIGSDSGQASQFFDGLVDELAIWHHVLSEADIQQLASGSGSSTSNPYSNWMATNVKDAMHQKSASLYARIPFQLPANSAYQNLTLQVRYDDGFVAYLNGTEVARRNSPQVLDWNSAATSTREDGAAVRLETIDLTAHLSKLKSGENLLAVHALNVSSSNPTFMFSPELVARQAPADTAQSGVRFSEVAAANATGDFIEIINRGGGIAPALGLFIGKETGERFALGAGFLAPDGYLTILKADLSFAITTGDKLFLYGSGGSVLDAVAVKATPVARDFYRSEVAWFQPSATTFGEPNRFNFNQQVVINEIMYHHAPRYMTNSPRNPEEIEEQWIELYNHSQTAVDLSGWSIAGGVEFSFPANTTLEGDSYLVVANNKALLAAKYPGIQIVGNLSGKLSRRGDELRLLDDAGNPVDHLRFYDGPPWPGYADGGGSTLEKRNPHADGSSSSSWAASNESQKSNWKRYTYRAKAITPQFSPSTAFFRELRLGLLNDGEALIDNVSVLEIPSTGPSRELVQNSNFSNGTTAWRALGNHSFSKVVPNPENASDNVLHLLARGSMSYLDNRLETTFKVGSSYVAVVPGREYEISFDAKWLAGSPQVHAEIYYNKVTFSVSLDQPEKFGTPGERNSIYVANAGPSYANLRHTPVVPSSSNAIMVTTEVVDADGIESILVRYSVNQGAWRSVAMAAQSIDPKVFQGTIPPQPNGAVVQFYVEGTDRLGASSVYPAGGVQSRALIKIGPVATSSTKQVFRTIMTASDSSLLHNNLNLMSDDNIPCTVVHNESEVYYDASIRLHGSMFSRPAAGGFTVKFPADHLFRGTRQSVVVRRSGMIESLLKHFLNQVGGLPANHDDIVHFVSHLGDSGPARMNLALYDDTFVDSQFENDNDGTIFKFEGIRIYQQTHNGSPEGFKLPQPVDFAWAYDLTDLGDDPEQYRWSIMIGNQRARDDYSRIINMGKAFKLTGSALQQAIAGAIDIEEWARMFALQNLFGIADIYGVDNPHNMAFYVRPSDGRALALQNDWGFPFALSSNGSIYGGQNVFKVFALPAYRRVYQGQMLSLSQALSSSQYINAWAQHYSRLTGEDYSHVAGYIAARINSIRSQLPASVPFEISSNSGNPMNIVAPTVVLQGRGWINVSRIAVDGLLESVPIKWLTERNWEIRVPLNLGINNLVLKAYDYSGELAGEDSIAVTTTSSGFSQKDNIRVTEIMYHPSDVTAAEAQAGFTDKNMFEFVELLNNSAVEISLLGMKFDAGIRFDFSSGSITQLAPGARLLVVADKNAFEFRNGTKALVAGEFDGQLDNNGEQIRLVDAFNVAIHDFSYDDGGQWPLSADGRGNSLEVISMDASYGSPANWRASSINGGTPGNGSAEAPKFLSISHEGEAVRMQFEAAAGQSYLLWYKNDLLDPEWQILQTFPSAEQSRVVEAMDTVNPTSYRFYILSIQ
ncbi:MAG: lamin tail domain-containing protein, partial [Verrucomicrobiales bacterium]